MIRDGIDHHRVTRKLRKDGWLPIEEAPLATPNVVDISAGIDIQVDPIVLEGLTAHGYVVEAHYDANGDYEDRWTNRYGNIVYVLTHWRPLR